MKEVVKGATDLCKLFIEKGGYSAFLVSAILALLAKIFVFDWEKSFLVFFCSLFLFYILSHLKNVCSSYCNNKKKQQKQHRENILKQDRRYKNLCVVYSSLSENDKQKLIELYKLPEETYRNVRIVKYNQHEIRQICYTIASNYSAHQIIGIEEGAGSYIITIDDLFCDILDKHVSDFE